MSDIIISSLAQGTVWAVMAIGTYITFRLLDIADLSAEGVFPLGAGIAAILISNGFHPILATLIAFLGGTLAGLVAGLVHTKLHIPPLLTGILVLTGLYTVNMRVMGRPNIPLINEPTIFKPLAESLDLGRNIPVIIIALLVLAVIIFSLNTFLNTEIGLGLRATGDNERMSQANGINTDRMKTLGYMLGNGLIALAGAMIAQKDGFADTGMGIGTIVIGLSSIIIAEVIIPNQPIGIRLASIIAGSFVYRLIIDLILNQRWFRVEPYDLELFNAILLAFVLFLPEFQQQLKRRQRRKNLQKDGEF